VVVDAQAQGGCFKRHQEYHFVMTRRHGMVLPVAAR
jgi:hypothetical protein